MQRGVAAQMSSLLSSSTYTTHPKPSTLGRRRRQSESANSDSACQTD